MEDLPELRLDLGGREFIATPLNAELFTFIGKTVLSTGETIQNSSRNHIFLTTGKVEEDGHDILTGTYIFSPETVEKIGAIMLHLDFPARVNQLNVPKSDEDAYRQYVDQQETAEEIPDTFPEDW